MLLKRSHYYIYKSTKFWYVHLDSAIEKAIGFNIKGSMPRDGSPLDGELGEDCPAVLGELLPALPEELLELLPSLPVDSAGSADIAMLGKTANDVTAK